MGGIIASFAILGYMWLGAGWVLNVAIELWPLPAEATNQIQPAVNSVQLNNVCWQNCYPQTLQAAGNVQ